MCPHRVQTRAPAHESIKREDYNRAPFQLSTKNVAKRSLQLCTVSASNIWPHLTTSGDTDHVTT
ncbi:hypothetical protein DBV15_09394 [Temnothorax longispinosus]|uniref:Uncharacterized protein n=1 Tax=Temnothorax longispinosus TaxID=300112 RepID=A0A4S2L530_9HYME|nr:hypothetical protein DBV15_09394 [Temnothorax longispinosus]